MGLLCVYLNCCKPLRDSRILITIECDSVVFMDDRLMKRQVGLNYQFAVGDFYLKMNAEISKLM